MRDDELVNTADDEYSDFEEGLEEQAALDAGDAADFGWNFPWPLLLRVSGLYERRSIKQPKFPWPFASESEEGAERGPFAETAEADVPEEDALIPFIGLREELRLDVDGRYPLQTASGRIRLGLGRSVQWIARLQRRSRYHWIGRIWYKHGATANFAYTTVEIRATPSFYPHQRVLRAVFSGGGASPSVRTYRFRSRSFHRVQFEVDSVESAPSVTTVQTAAHPNRPASLPGENLSIDTVFRRAGFAVSRTGARDVIPLSDAGTNGTWSDMEMHDAMQAYWSRFANQPQWSTWLLLASLHDRGTGLGGVMFDDIGPNHRQGTAVFGNAFIANAPANDPSPAAWVQRMRFWTAVHEMGHSFNLAHSWQKQHPSSWGKSWIPLQNEPEVRSFMNYPYNVAGGQAAFFSDFEYRFSDQELLFMRHAPAQFVQMGNADWFDEHGFEQQVDSALSDLRLEVRVQREKPVFEFLEPANVELKLENTSSRPIVIDRNLLGRSDHLTVILKRQGRPARQWAPYATYCLEPDPILLQPGDSLYHSLMVGSGLNGWDLAEPGQYIVQVALEHESQSIVSNSLVVTVESPSDAAEERLAQDLLTDDVGRVLAFGGSRYFDTANDALHRAAKEFAGRRIATHARLALAQPCIRNYKVLSRDGGPELEVVKADLDTASRDLGPILFRNANRTAETLGHIEYRARVESLNHALEADGRVEDACGHQHALEKVLKRRGVKASVLGEIAAERTRLESKVKGG